MARNTAGATSRTSTPNPSFRPKRPSDAARCRLGPDCEATGDALAIRRVYRDGATMPTLCCAPCALAAHQTAQASA